MEIIKYLDEMEHAISHVLSEVYREREHAEKLSVLVAENTRAMEDGYRRSEWLAMNPDFDDEGLGTAIHWDTYFGPDKDRHYNQIKLNEINAQVEVHNFSTDALASNVLQYAKQGISLRYGANVSEIPDGRTIGSLSVREIVWQARNQSLHWEEGKFNSSVVKCFESLEREQGAIFGEYRERNMAFEILKLLEWSEFEKVKADMLLLETMPTTP